MASLAAGVICYLVTWRMTSGVEDVTVPMLVGTMFLTGIVTVIAVGAALLLIHCLLVDWVLIN